MIQQEFHVAKLRVFKYLARYNNNIKLLAVYLRISRHPLSCWLYRQISRAEGISDLAEGGYGFTFDRCSYILHQLATYT